MNLQKRAELLADFIMYCKKEIGINTLPKIIFSSSKAWASKTHAMGQYQNDTKSLIVYISHRNLADICRTLAHELTHHKQNEDKLLYRNSGKTGSDVENEAHIVSSIIMRDYGLKHPEIYE